MEINNKPQGVFQRLEESINTALGLEKIDWGYRNFKDQFLKDNPQLKNTEYEHSANFKDAYNDVKKGYNPKTIELNGVPLKYANAILKIDPKADKEEVLAMDKLNANKVEDKRINSLVNIDISKYDKRNSVLSMEDVLNKFKVDINQVNTKSDLPLQNSIQKGNNVKM